MKQNVLATFVGLMLGIGLACAASDGDRVEPKTTATSRLEVATFGGGCFWCMEGAFEKLEGVNTVISGYTGGVEKNPSDEEVARGTTGHTEAIQISFNPAIISYEDLLETYWKNIDPTDSDGQFADRGSQYRPGIFHHNEAQKNAAEISKLALDDSEIFKRPIAVEITAYASFYPAENRHQDYYRKDPEHYNAYRKGSGRAGFLEKTWGNN